MPVDFDGSLIELMADQKFMDLFVPDVNDNANQESTGVHQLGKNA